MIEDLPSILAPYQLAMMGKFAQTLPPGDFAEVGVFHGGSASLLYQVAMLRGSQLHLFDTFKGTPYYTEGLDYHKIDREFADEEAPERIRRLMPTANLYIGVYPETHPEGLKDLAFVHCDCDQYQSYRAVIDRMWPLVVPGGAMLFDDYPYLEGAKRAVEESFGKEELKLLHQRYYVVKKSV